MNQPDSHTSLKSTQRTLAILTALFLLVWWLPVPEPAGAAGYLPLHTTLEIAAVAIAFLVAAVGWHAWQRAAPRPVLLIATAYIGVAILDIGHLLSYDGMPDFITASDPEKGINFWLAARLLAAGALLGAACMTWPLPDDTILPGRIQAQQQASRRFRWQLLIPMTMLVSAIYWVILYRMHWLPATFHPETGLTCFKIATEWAIIAMHLLAAALLWQKRQKLGQIDVNALILAVLVTALSELFFTLYDDVTDTYNLVGHIYKVIAYYFLYRALAISGIDQPYSRLARLQARQQTTLNVVPDMVMEIDRNGIISQFHSNYDRLLALRGDQVGRNVFDYLPEAVASSTKAMLDEIDSTGAKASMEYCLNIDGEELWYSATGARLPEIPDQTQPHYILLVRDITEEHRVRSELQNNQRMMETAFDNMPFGIAINSIEGHSVEVRYMNDRFPEIYDADPDCIRNLDGFWLQVYPDPAQRQQIRDQVLSDVASGDPNRMIWRNVPLYRPGKPTRYVTAQNIPLPEDDLYLSLVFDVTAQVEAEQELRIAAAAFESQEAIMITDAEQKILRVNRAFEETNGYTEAEVRGKTPKLLQSGRHDQAFYQTMWQKLHKTGFWRGEVWNRRKNGELYPQRLIITAVKDENGLVSHYLADFMDTTALNEAQRRIDELALFDPLTGLSNRQRLLEQLQQSVEQHSRNHRFGGIVFIDVDNFKTINDTLGYASGDKLLIAIADRLRQFATSDTVIARNGADEFVLILPDVGTCETSAAVYMQAQADALLQQLTGDFSIDGQHYYNRVSLGVTIFHDLQYSAAELLNQVDLATHQIKQIAGSQIGFYSSAMQELVAGQATLENELRQAIRDQQFVLLYQPLVNREQQIIGAEALLRWQHPQRGLIGPGEFIGTLERTGMILELERWVLEQALKQRQRWQQQAMSKDWSISINIAADPFYEEDFCPTVERLLADCDVDPASVILEFTEGTLLRDVKQAREKILQLSALGVRFAIDDFGTGYSSLSYLSQLPVHELKIDQSFVQSLHQDPSNAAIIRMIIEMSQILDIDVVAEGVESTEQFDYLLQHGCGQFQGYLFSKPMAQIAQPLASE